MSFPVSPEHAICAECGYYILPSERRAANRLCLPCRREAKVPPAQEGK